MENQYRVLLRSSSTQVVVAHELVFENGGAIAFYGDGGKLIVAYAAQDWLSVEEA